MRIFSQLHFISIHAPAKGATIHVIQQELDITDFNPRSREGSDSITGAFSDTPVISIHAPAKGATGTTSKEAADTIISIHAPAKGATRSCIRNI